MGVCVYLSALSDTNEDLQVHVDKADERQDPCCQSRMPYQRQSVPEYEVRIPPGLAWIHLIGAIVLGQGHLHELGRVEGEGEHGDRHDVDQQPLTVAHRLKGKGLIC